MPFSAHPLFAHPSFSDLQATFSGGTVQRLVVLDSATAERASFLPVVRALLLLLEEQLTAVSTPTKEDKATGRLVPSPILRSVFVPLPSLDDSSFRIFRVSGESITKFSRALPESSEDRASKSAQTALAPHSLAISALSTVSNVGLLSFLRVDFPLAFIAHKQQSQS